MPKKRVRFPLLHSGSELKMNYHLFFSEVFLKVMSASAVLLGSQIHSEIEPCFQFTLERKINMSYL